ncbi:chitobiase/beta-hexosaminidase C-terminal domain-containing protein [Paenibacillus sp. PAMC21692]|uniref:chitobiase/beta-hexosaminidase C-terminal domain-containing protein n=1 Tax=Paenibacillus sp. PAMC21692 TaxID=2762320 RepID=UPI00164E3AC7|nr:chitobiase/beta-hexosaminidase C-terminal domain-containing protein [Paenibacillus sp. PAMC21692]QNK57015.1 chitobiase/beta-hexosaminidase C-terminal domain-containing protein [Paenibacillus sp. PAMC21692]
MKIIKKYGMLLLAAAVMFQTLLFSPEPAAANASPESFTVDIDLQTIINDDFLGVGANIIPVSFMEGTNRFGYNEAHWEMDRKRILAMKPRVARVWFQTDWMELEKGVYQWDSDKMIEFYRYMDVLQEAGTEIEFNFGWKVGVEAQEWFSFPDVDKRISAPVDLDAFANAASAALNQLINVKGYDHIKYLTFYNEANGNWDFEAPGDQKAYFAQMVKKVSDKLTADGLRDLVDIWGPEESGAPDWTQYMQENADEYFDAYTFHVYGQSYDGLTKSITDRTSVAGGKPVMMTEFGFAEDNSAWNAGLAGSVIKAANMGLGGALIWQLNGVWLPNPYVGNDTNGNYTMWDSLVLGTDPYRRYYESSLLTRYIPPHSSVVAVDTGSEDIRAAVFKTDDGEMTIVLETKEGTNKEVAFDFNEAVNKSFNKHVYRADVSIDGNALIPGVSHTFAAGDSFADDEINAEHNVIVYTTMSAQTQVEVTPLESTVEGGETQTFDANVIDNSSGVTWSVIGEGNGTITNDGLYTAPSVTEEKLIALKATSIQDDEGYGIALVKVRPTAAEGQATIPAFSLPYGKYPSGEAVTITTATPDAEIRYTLDGSTPTLASELYTKPIFLLRGTTPLKAVAFKDGMNPSPVSFSLYKMANASLGPDGYQFCAYENGFDCEFTGEASVAFGSDGLFHYANLTDGAACTSALFGDPNPGTEKRCYFTYNIPAELPVVTVYNAGFEKPNVANYQTGPMTNGWYFNVRAGIQRNGGQFGAARAPEGGQTAFMVGRSFIGGEISQKLHFKEGDYELWFSMASRSTPGGELPFDIYFDDTLIGSFEPNSSDFTLHKTDSFTAAAGYHTIKFVGAATETDHAVFLDGIKVRTAGMAPPPPDVQEPLPPEKPLETLGNAGFEEPQVATHRAGPMKFSWNFNLLSGVQRNGGAFAAATAPEGIQTAFLQTKGGQFGEISQYLNFEEGRYKLEFSAAKRSTNGGRTQSFDVYFDDTIIGSYSLTSPDFESLSTISFNASEGPHTIKFVATHTSGQSETGESTGFIDEVSLRDVSGEPPDPEEPAEEPVALLEGPSEVHAGDTLDLKIGISKANEGYSAMDVIVHYDPAKLEFETIVDDDGHLILSSNAIQSLVGQLQVIGTGVKPEQGQIRILMLGTGAPVSEDGHVIALQGKAKASASAGSTIITLSDFGISNESAAWQVDSHEAMLTVQVIEVDKSALNAEIVAAQALHDGATEGSHSGQYPVGSKNVLHAAILAAKAVNENSNATKQQVMEAVSTLQQAVMMFRNSVHVAVPADKTALIAAIDNAQSKHDAAVDDGKLGHYAPGSKASLQTAIDAAKAVRESTSVTQTNVNDAVSGLNDAVQHFASQLVTLVEGNSRISIADLSIVAKYYGINSENASWNEIAIADLLDEGEITIRTLAAVARMILDDWLAE